MAKKKEELSLEEKLERALVPESEQPYDVPDNWVWTSVSEVCKLSNGIKKKDEEHKYLEVKYLRRKVEAKIKNTGNYIEKNDRIILVDGENSGEVFCVVEEGYMGSTLKKLDICKYINTEYFEYYISTYREEFRNSKTGSAIPHLNKALFREKGFPLPPLTEQKRIVTRIESLFTKLDEAKELVQSALDSFEHRKSAIQHKAFTGELTAKWREENGVSIDSWETVKLREISKIVRGGSPRPAGDERFYNGNIPFMKVADLTGKSGRYVNDAKHSIKEAGLRKTRFVENGTLLLTNSGATLGVPAITNIDTTFNDGIAAFLELNDNVNFLYYYLLTQTEMYRSINKGAAQPNLNTEIIGETILFRPTIMEQNEIVSILDNIFKNLNKSKELFDILERIDLIKISILAKVFRGELGTNDVNDESGIEVLKEILQSR